MAVSLFKVREFLSKLEELVGKLTYDNDPVKAKKPALQKRADTLLQDLLKRSHFEETVYISLLCHDFLAKFPEYFFFPLFFFFVVFFF